MASTKKIEYYKRSILFIEAIACKIKWALMAFQTMKCLNDL